MVNRSEYTSGEHQVKLILREARRSVRALAIVTKAVEFQPVVNHLHLAAANLYAAGGDRQRLIDIEHATTLGAREMLMIFGAGLESRVAFSKIQLPHHAQFLEELQASIYGSKRNMRHAFPDHLVNLIGLRMILRFGKLLENYSPLASHPITLLLDLLVKDFSCAFHR